MAGLVLLAMSAGPPLAAQGIAHDDLPVVAPVYRQPRPAYDPPRFKLGSFLLSPSFQQTLSYDDNIFASDRIRAGDAISTSSEELSLQSQWSRHSLSGRAYFAQQVYSDHSSEDANIFGVEGQGRFDVSNSGFLTFSSGFVQQPQKRDSPQANIAALGRPVYNTVRSAVGYDQGWGSWRNQALIEVTKTAYISDSEAGRSSTELRYRDRLSFAAAGFARPFLQVAYSTRNWRRNGSLRNFDSFTAIAGLRVAIADLVDGEFGAGVLRQGYRNGKFDTLVTPSFSGRLTWNILPLTTLSASADRTVTGIESFCDPSLRLACDTLAGNSIPQLIGVLNGYSGCGDGHCGNAAQFYAAELRNFTNELRYRLQFSMPQPNPAKFLKDVPGVLLNQFPGISASSVNDPALAIHFGEELRQSLLRYDQGNVIGLSDQRGALEVLSLEFGVQHEFWHDFLGEARFRFEEDRFEPAGLVDQNYSLNANGRWLINRNLELDLSYIRTRIACSTIPGRITRISFPSRSRPPCNRCAGQGFVLIR